MDAGIVQFSLPCAMRGCPFEPIRLEDAAGIGIGLAGKGVLDAVFLDIFGDGDTTGTGMLPGRAGGGFF